MTTPSEQDPSPLISISYSLWLDKFASGVHNFATVSKEFGLYISQQVDPNELLSHVDFPKGEGYNKIAYVYPINAWLAAVRRNEIMKASSERDRQLRFEMEARALELKKKFEDREKFITVYMNIMRKRFGGWYAKIGNNEKMLREIVTTLLSGQGQPAVRDAIDIDEDAIAIFQEFPKPTDEENLILDILTTKSTTTTTT